MEAGRHSDTPLSYPITTRRYKPEDHNLKLYRRENHKFHIGVLRLAKGGPIAQAQKMPLSPYVRMYYCDVPLC